MSTAGRTLWTPPADWRTSTRLGEFLEWLEAERGVRLPTYQSAWEWSISELEEFWAAVWDHFDVRAHEPHERVLRSREMPGAVWFPGATLNYAEHALRLTGVDPDTVVVRSYSQTREPVLLTASELRHQVAACRDGLASLGVGPGDRVAAYAPNIAETLVAFLATASLGAVWSSCAPEFGVRSVVDRLGQIEPKVLITVDGYRYGDRLVDRTAEVAEVRAALPSLAATVLVPYLGPDTGSVPGAVVWDDLLAAGDGAVAAFEPVPFAHPLYVLYSSGTTGLPKPIVHGHGGILLEHLKVLALHNDLGPGDRFFWFSTTGWMMWNYLVSGLLVGAELVLFDGNPGWPDLGELWRLAGSTAMTYFGTSAPFLMACRKEGLRPADMADLRALRGVGSTGAPLPAEGFEWVSDAVGPEVMVSSISGGTDVCTAFVGGTPQLPVRAGVIACRYLGCAVEAYDPLGRPVIGEQGELVITEPMPSMPIGFWNDDGSRLRSAYFEAYAGVWRHGDWLTVEADGSCIISGRSDATLNRGGVRLGTSDFYAVVEELPEVADSLVVHLPDPEDAAGELVLFVALAPGAVLDDGLRGRIAAALRRELSPRHVPDRVEQVPTVPRTLSGKKLEVPVKRILEGKAADEVASRGALADPAALAPFEAMAPRRLADGGGPEH
jgi:acetoacetyl-CoA synthetase